MSKRRETLLDHDIDSDLVERLLIKSNAPPTCDDTGTDTCETMPKGSIMAIRQAVKLWDLDVKHPKKSAA